MNKVKITIIIFWIHLILVIASYLNIFNFPDSTIAGFYLFITIFYFIRYRKTKNTIYSIMIYILLVLGGYLLNNRYFTGIILYYFCFYIVNKNTKLNFQETVNLINKSFIFYLMISVIFNYLFNGYFSNYEIRNIQNKFIPYINRFIGIEGSPAGPDIISLIVILLNYYSKNFKSRKKYMLLGFIVLVWCSSLSNIIGLIYAIIFFRFKSQIKIIFFIQMLPIFYLHKWILLLENLYLRKFLSFITVNRVKIWELYYEGYISHYSILEKYFGSKKLVEISIDGLQFTNPHNAFISIEHVCGKLFMIIFIIYCTNKIYYLKKESFIIVISILFYATTTGAIFVPSYMPVIMYVLIWNLNMNGSKIDENK